MSEQKPKIDFIGLGVPKAGTTWAYACLQAHPEIEMLPKEIHFFNARNLSHRPDLRDKYTELGMSWYREQIPKREAGKIIGEFDTLYLFDEKAPERIRAEFPDAKLIAILRDPIERFRSQFRDMTSKLHYDKLPKDAMAFIDAVPDQVGLGNYGDQLERYREEFEKGRLLVMIYEDIQRDPAAFMRRIYEFIGVDETFEASMLQERINPTGPQVVRHRAIKNKDRVASHPAGQMLLRVLKSIGIYDSLRDVLLNTTRKRFSYDPTPSEVHERLSEIYQPQIRKVESMTGLKLDIWSGVKSRGHIGGPKPVETDV